MHFGVFNRPVDFSVFILKTDVPLAPGVDGPIHFSMFISKTNVLHTMHTSGLKGP